MSAFTLTVSQCKCTLVALDTPSIQFAAKIFVCACTFLLDPNLEAMSDLIYVSTHG